MDVRSRRAIVLLGAMSAFGPLSFDLYLPALPGVVDDLGTTGSWAQWTMSACMVGLAAGQLVVGPISDRVGRRRPLVVGTASFAVLSVLCGLAPDVGVLVVLRFLQGLAGSAGIVVSRAVVRDVWSGPRLARTYSQLALLTGAAPIVAPVIGGQLLRVTDWRGVFFVLAGVAALLCLAATRLPETLAALQPHDPGATVRRGGVREVLTDRLFLASTAVAVCTSAGVFTYISLSSIVLQEGYGLSPQVFSLVFSANALAFVACSSLNSRLVLHHEPRRLMVVGVALQVLGGTLCLLAGLLGWGLAVVLPALAVAQLANGFVGPNSFALGLTHHSRNAGTASAISGTASFLVGALVAPLVGLAGSGLVPLGSAFTVAFGLSCLVTIGWVYRYARAGSALGATVSASAGAGTVLETAPDPSGAVTPDPFSPVAVPAVAGPAHDTEPPEPPGDRREDLHPKERA